MNTLDSPSVVILAPSDDLHAQCVARELEKNRGTAAIVLDAAGFPMTWALAIETDSSGRLRVLVESTERTLDLSAVTGVWWRRPRRHFISEEIVDERVKQFCLDESRALFEGWIYALGDRVINPLHAEMAANQKPLQIYAAQRVGLQVPHTLFSNCPARVQDFAQRLNQPVVFKTFTTLNWHMCETREMMRQMYKELPSLQHAPAIFQEKIDKKADIRVTIVDTNVFSVLVHTDHPGAQLDWRLDVAATVSPFELPFDQRERLLALMSTLGLRYGAIDLALDRDGNYVFFEVNPGGQYLWIEIHAGQPISAALAAALSNGPGRP